MPNPVPPATDPTWATDANFTNGPAVGTPTKVVPSGGVQAEGNVPADLPPAQWMNWWQNLVYLWVLYFKAWVATMGWYTQVNRALDMFCPCPLRGWSALGVDWTLDGSYHHVASAGAKEIFFHLPVTPGGRIIGLHLEGHVNNGVTPLVFDMVAWNHGGTETDGVGGAANSVNVTGDFSEDLDFVTPEIVGDNTSYYLRVTSGSANDKVWSAYVKYKDKVVRTTQT